MRGWARSCPSSFAAHALIAEGELARVRGRSRRADACFERAVTAARAHASPKREALALELRAANARAMEPSAEASRYLREAIDAYGRWGAAAKVEALAGAGGVL